MTLQTDAICYGSNNEYVAYVARDAGVKTHIACPVMGFYGSKDTRLMASLPGFVEKMKAAGKHLEPHVYEGAEHAYFNDARPAFDVNATRDSFARTLSFFASVLA